MVTKVTDELLSDTLDLSGKTITMPAANTPVFTKYFESAEQAVAANTTTSVEHGLGVTPKFIAAFLRCKIADLNFAIGDEVSIDGTTYQNTAVRNGFTFANSTHIGISVITGGFSLINKTTAASGTITADNWRIVLRAYA